MSVHITNLNNTSSKNSTLAFSKSSSGILPTAVTPTKSTTSPSISPEERIPHPSHNMSSSLIHSANTNSSPPPLAVMTTSNQISSLSSLSTKLPQHKKQKDDKKSKNLFSRPSRNTKSTLINIDTNPLSPSLAAMAVSNKTSSLSSFSTKLQQQKKQKDNNKSKNVSQNHKLSFSPSPPPPCDIQQTEKKQMKSRAINALPASCLPPPPTISETIVGSSPRRYHPPSVIYSNPSEIAQLSPQEEEKEKIRTSSRKKSPSPIRAAPKKFNADLYKGKLSFMN